ncbi:MAG: hypothetical protein JXQ96_09595 [Cyclobacteriaceae bacterium]
MDAIILSLDLGLVVLIWIVQLIIYPGFAYYESTALVRWHHKYTMYITIIVMPLMIGQVLAHGIDTFSNYSWFKALACILILMNWVITFMYAVPLHNQIGKGVDTSTAVKALVRSNWPRTILWTMVFVLQCLIIYQGL